MMENPKILFYWDIEGELSLESLRRSTSRTVYYSLNRHLELYNNYYKFDLSLSILLHDLIESKDKNNLELAYTIIKNYKHEKKDMEMGS